MKEMTRRMVNWQRIWDDDGNIPLKIITHILSFFYSGIVTLRNRLYDNNIFKEVKLSCPVISVGNITVGGTGKTPCVIMLARMLKENGFRPAIISRGYGGHSTGPVNIVSDGDKILLDSETAGDEPFLMANVLKGIPVITGARRIITGQAAIDQLGANILVCDDAMQHRQIFRDVNLVLLDSAGLNGNYHVLPRGKLREPVEELRRASAILLTHADDDAMLDTQIEEVIKAHGIPIFRSIHQAEDIISGDEKVQKPISELRNKDVYAFCGIANPDSFKKTLLAAGAKILFFEVFPDHHPYSAKEIEKIKKDLLKSGADYLMTTQKDAMRLQNHPEFLKMIFILRIKMEIKKTTQSFEDFIIKKVRSYQNKSKGN
jgi:tetraacyldisaccharide 4'-kinase